MLNFNRLRNSAFWRTGRARFNYFNQSYLPDSNVCMFETTEQLYPDKFSKERPWHANPLKWITINSLQKALAIRPFIHNHKEQPFLPDDFRSEINRQFLKVSTTLTETRKNNPHADIIDSFFLLVEPNVPIPMHLHQVKQTLVLCFNFNETKTSKDDSYFFMGFKSRTPIKLPDDAEFYFEMKDDPPHEVLCNEWRFFWFTDFSDYITIPNIDLLQWENPFLLGKNLIPEDHEYPNKLNIYY